jgi:UPF0716 protein FxsA
VAKGTSVPGFILLLFFIGVPVIEIAVFIEIGGKIGLGWTIAIVILTAIAGSSLLRIQGLATLRRAQESMARNELPLREVFDGMCLIFAGALLLTPGFVTDTVGALLFLPPVRNFLRLLAGRWILRSATVHTTTTTGGSGPDNGFRRHDDDIIEGEWEDVSDRPGEANDARLTSGRDTER